MIDALARRYGRLPHEILRLDPEQLGLALAAYVAGRELEGELIRRAGTVFPAVVLGGG